MKWSKFFNIKNETSPQAAASNTASFNNRKQRLECRKVQQQPHDHSGKQTGFRASFKEQPRKQRSSDQTNHKSDHGLRWRWRQRTNKRNFKKKNKQHADFLCCCCCLVLGGMLFLFLFFSSSHCYWFEYSLEYKRCVLSSGEGIAQTEGRRKLVIWSHSDFTPNIGAMKENEETHLHKITPVIKTMI